MQPISGRTDKDVIQDLCGAVPTRPFFPSCSRMHFPRTRIDIAIVLPAEKVASEGPDGKHAIGLPW